MCFCVVVAEGLWCDAVLLSEEMIDRLLEVSDRGVRAVSAMAAKVPSVAERAPLAGQPTRRRALRCCAARSVTWAR